MNTFDPTRYPFDWSTLSIPKRKIFISYHHGGDQAYYDAFSAYFCQTYEIITDRSLRDPISSDDPEYVMRRIRERYISGSSCTIVLCGRETRWRKYVDWEIKATLDRQHGLIGVLLPTNPVFMNTCAKPDRLQDNIDTGYAVWTNWSSLIANAGALSGYIEEANKKPTGLIVNTRQLMSRNGTPSWHF